MSMRMMLTRLKSFMERLMNTTALMAMSCLRPKSCLNSWNLTAEVVGLAAVTVEVGMIDETTDTTTGVGIDVTVPMEGTPTVYRYL